MEPFQGGLVHRDDVFGHAASRAGRTNLVAQAAGDTMPRADLRGVGVADRGDATSVDTSADRQATSNRATAVDGAAAPPESSDQAESVSSGPSDCRTGRSRDDSILAPASPDGHPSEPGSVGPGLSVLAQGQPQLSPTTRLPAHRYSGGSAWQRPADGGTEVDVHVGCVRIQDWRRDQGCHAENGNNRGAATGRTAAGGSPQHLRTAQHDRNDAREHRPCSAQASPGATANGGGGRSM